MMRASHSRRPRLARPSRRARGTALVTGAVALAAFAFIVQLLRPAPGLEGRALVPAVIAIPAGGPPMTPVAGAETAVAVEGVGLFYSSDHETDVPIASVTKMMSALVILANHPLRIGEAGPSIAVTRADVTSYEQEKASGDSVVAVREGEQLSELDALDAVLVPSADNVVRLLAKWDAGSIAAFVAKMNAEARRLGLVHTHYAGPSGVNPASVSTAFDQVRLAEVALRNPVIASIVALPQVTLPVAGVQYNVDADLGHDGIVGVKTGWVPQGGASFVFAATAEAASQRKMVIGAIVGEQDASPLPSVLADAERLVRTVDVGLLERHVVAARRQVAVLDNGYGRPVPVVTATPVSLLVWRGAHVSQRVTISRNLGEVVRAGGRVGTLTVGLESEHITVRLVAKVGNAGPSLAWRLSRW